MNTRTFARLISVGSICLFVQSQAPACELMGFSFNQRVPVHHALSVFRYRGSHHPDGWGIALYPDKSAALLKEAASAAESDLAEFLAGYKALKSKLLVVHVRRATVGGQSHQNTHPFLRELNGREFVLAHNGTLENFREKLKLSAVKPIGVNDSEFLLCYLLGQIGKRGVAEWGDASLEWLQGELRRINDCGSLNCLFSEGRHLFAYHDKNGYNSLHYLLRRAPYSRVRFTDLPEEIDLSTVYAESVAGVVVATKPLTNEEWTEFTPGQLLVFKDGVRVFPGM